MSTFEVRGRVSRTGKTRVYFGRKVGGNLGWVQIPRKRYLALVKAGAQQA